MWLAGSFPEFQTLNSEFHFTSLCRRKSNADEFHWNYFLPVVEMYLMYYSVFILIISVVS